MIWRKTVKAFAILHYYDNEVALASKEFYLWRLLNQLREALLRFSQTC